MISLRLLRQPQAALAILLARSAQFPSAGISARSRDGLNKATKALWLVSVLWAPLGFAQVDVATSIQPLALIANDILGEAGNAVALIKPGDSPHHASLTPSARLVAARADILLWIGEDFEVNLVSLFQEPGSRTGSSTITASTLAGITLREVGIENHDDDLDLDTAHNTGHDPAHDPAHGTGHDTAQSGHNTDLPLWLDTHNAERIAAAVATAASALNPADAAGYAQRLQAFSAAQAAIRADFAARSPDDGIAAAAFVVYHDAYGYLERDMGLAHAAALLADPERAPTIRELTDVRAAIASAAPVCLFSEPGADPRLIDTALAGHALRRVELDALGAQIEAGAEGYSRFIRGLAQDIQGCLSAP